MLGRLHLFEIHEASWCPASLRDALTDTLQFYSAMGRPFERVEGRIAQALVKVRKSRVVDLCSGAGGPWPGLLGRLSERTGQPVAVTLTDLHPHSASQTSDPDVRLSRSLEPVDARAVPAGLAGFRCCFSSFHHFRPGEAVEVLRDCAERGEGVAVVEAQCRTLGSFCFFLLYVPLTLCFVPLVRPWSWSRLFWTYCVPLLPLVITFDALVSCARTYDVDELEALAAEAFGERMDVDIGRLSASALLPEATYLIATPRG